MRGLVVGDLDAELGAAQHGALAGVRRALVTGRSAERVRAARTARRSAVDAAAAAEAERRGAHFRARNHGPFAEDDVAGAQIPRRHHVPCACVFVFNCHVKNQIQPLLRLVCFDRVVVDISWFVDHSVDERVETGNLVFFVLFVCFFFSFSTVSPSELVVGEDFVGAAVLLVLGPMTALVFLGAVAHGAARRTRQRRRTAAHRAATA